MKYEYNGVVYGNDRQSRIKLIDELDYERRGQLMSQWLFEHMSYAEEFYNDVWEGLTASPSLRDMYGIKDTKRGAGV